MTNEERQERGLTLVETYVGLVYGPEVTVDEEGEDTCAIDTITDILHWAKSCGFDIQRIVDWAVTHCEAEAEEEENALNP